MGDSVVNDGFLATLQSAFKQLRDGLPNVNYQAQLVATAFVENADSVNKQRFYNAMNRAIGIDVREIVQGEGLGETIAAATTSNVKLITRITDDYFNRIEDIILRGTMAGNSSKSMIEELRTAGATSDNHARLIARDQTTKLNAVLSKSRQQNLGVTEYIWRSAEDSRVRPEHVANNGKTFKWGEPPANTGHPGTDIQCRCVAQAIIKI